MARLVLALTATLLTLLQSLPIMAGQLVLSTSTGKRLTFDYCWVEEDQVRFEIGGGMAALSKDLVKALEEIIDREEVIPEALEKNAITVESFDPETALKQIAARFYGISINFTDESEELLAQASQSKKEKNLYGAITQSIPELSVYQLVHRPPRPSFLFVTTFFTSRTPIDKKSIYLELLDMDGNIVDRIPATVSFIDIPKKERIEKKIARLFYVAYAFIPVDKEFWTYQFVLERMVWDTSGQNRSALLERKNFGALRL